MSPTERLQKQVEWIVILISGCLLQLQRRSFQENWSCQEWMRVRFMICFVWTARADFWLFVTLWRRLIHRKAGRERKAQFMVCFCPTSVSRSPRPSLRSAFSNFLNILTRAWSGIMCSRSSLEISKTECFVCVSGIFWRKLANWHASWKCDFSLDVKPCLSKYLIKPWKTLHHLMRSPRLLCKYVWVGIGVFSYICYIECWGTFNRSYQNSVGAEMGKYSQRKQMQQWKNMQQ